MDASSHCVEEVNQRTVGSRADRVCNLSRR